LSSSLARFRDAEPGQKERGHEREVAPTSGLSGVPMRIPRPRPALFAQREGSQDPVLFLGMTSPWIEAAAYSAMPVPEIVL
jgi:hypothetical protein